MKLEGNRKIDINIQYYSYSEEIIEEIESGKIHIFQNSQDVNIGKEKYQEKVEKDKSVFDKQPKIMTTRELKTNLFLSDKIIVKEEKQVIAFYRALTLKNKKELGVETYYDVIDIAANFLNFFKLLKEYRIENLKELKELRPWQKKIYELFMNIKKNYIKFLEDRNFTDPVFLIDDKNYTSASLKGMKKEIIFYNKLYFSEQEKWILEKLCEDRFKITLKLQVKKENFCEKNLRLIDINLDKNMDKVSKEIEIYTVDDDFTELVKILDILEKNKEKEGVKKYRIFDGNNENYRYNKFFQSRKYISDFPMFRLLDGIHQLLSTLEIISGEIAIELYSVVEVIKWDEIKEHYNITFEELEDLKKLIKEGYKYLTKDVLGNSLKEDHFIVRIFQDLEEMKSYNSLKEWLEKITFNKEILTKLLNEKSIGKYFEALSEIAVIEDLDIVDNWDGFFGVERSEWENRKSEGLLKLILKYLEFKEVEEVKKIQLDKDGNEVIKPKKLSIDELETKQNKDLLFINMSDKYLPKKAKNTFLFTEQQKKDLGIKSVDDERLEEKYNFFRAILTSETSTIIGIKNLSDDSSLSPFVEELIDIFSLEVKHIKQKVKNYIEMIKPQSKLSNIVEEEKSEVVVGEAPEVMKFELEELGGSIGLNAYSAGEFFNCKYKMNLKYLKKLEIERLEVERNLTVREYGILAHELFESVLKRLKLEKNYSSLENGRVNRESIMKDLKKFIGSRRLKLPKLNEKYYEEIVYKNLVYSVEKFFQQISRELSGEVIKELEIEKPLSRKIIDYKNFIMKKDIEINGKGKADLIIKTDKENYIIDFKTGNLNEMQLDFYSILEAGESNLTKKYIFNVDKGSLGKSDKIKLIKEERNRINVDPDGKNKKLEVLETGLKEFLDLKEFTRNQSSDCTRCHYINICKASEVIDG